MKSQIELLKKRAKEDPKTVVLPEGREPRILEAAKVAVEEGVARIILVGNKKEVESRAKKSGIPLNKIQLIDPETYPKLDELVDIFYKSRKHKGVTQSDAREAVLGNRVYFGALLVKTGVADGFVAGASHTTSNVARAALYCIGLAPDISVMSSSFVVEFPNMAYGDKGLFVYADCGIVPNPNHEQLADIAISTRKLYKELFSGSPRVALLSYSTKGSARGESVDKVLKALEIIRKKSPGLLVDGELQLDSAIVPDVAEIKAPSSTVAGTANILIFPNLDAGNICYKLSQRLGNARVAGPLLQGLNKPASDLSRGCFVGEVVDSIAATAVRAQAC